MVERKHHERIIRISRRVDMPTWQKFLIKLGFILFAFLMCGVISTMVAPNSFGRFYEELFKGSFSSTKSFVPLLWETGLLFIIALALAPAFKMKFWNIGAEGQCLMGALGALIAMKFIAPNIPSNFLAILIEIIFAVIFGMVWAFIPAFFKARFNTNETLFTLMMNYIAMGLVAACELAWKARGKTSIGIVNRTGHQGWLPFVGSLGNSYILNIIIIVFIAVLVWVYLRFSKHGYELSVVGGSRETAKYVGINVRAVIVRTMILSGLICGVVGFLVVCGGSHTITSNSIGGKGFTSIMICWLGGFSVPLMALYSFLVAFISTGSVKAAGVLGYTSYIGDVLTGLFFILVLVSTFFVNFKLHIRLPNFRKAVAVPAIETPVYEEENKEDK